MTFTKSIHLSQQSKDQMTQLRKLKEMISSETKKRGKSETETIPSKVKTEKNENAVAEMEGEKRKASEAIDDCDTKKPRLAELSV